MLAGELAALGTATSWTGSSLSFEAAAKRIGSLSLNFWRVVMALAWLSIGATIASGGALPDATASQWGFLLASGFVGLALGDLCTFRAYVEIGAQRTMVVSTVTPIFTAALAWVALDEAIDAIDAAGMAVIVGGVALAVRDRRPARATVVEPAAPADPVAPGTPPAPAVPAVDRARLVRGVLLALGGSLGQAGGLLLAKRALGSTASIAQAIGATQIRMVAGITGFVLVLTFTRWWPRAAAAARDGRAMTFTAIGALLGPGVGVSLSLYAITHAPAGVASAIMSTTPILVIPVVLARGERIGPLGVAGAVLAVAGVVILSR